MGRLPLTCAECGCEYAKPYRHVTVGWCCPVCLKPLRAYVALAGSKKKGKRSKVPGRVKKRRVRSLLRRDGSLCWICGEDLAGDMTLDHVLPRSKGGADNLGNLRLAHRACNHARGCADPPLV